MQVADEPLRLSEVITKKWALSSIRHCSEVSRVVSTFDPFTEPTKKVALSSHSWPPKAIIRQACQHLSPPNLNLQFPTQRFPAAPVLLEQSASNRSGRAHTRIAHCLSSIYGIRKSIWRPACRSIHLLGARRSFDIHLSPRAPPRQWDQSPPLKLPRCPSIWVYCSGLLPNKPTELVLRGYGNPSENSSAADCYDRVQIARSFRRSSPPWEEAEMEKMGELELR